MARYEQIEILRYPQTKIAIVNYGITKMKSELFLIGLVVAILCGFALLIGVGNTEARIALGITCLAALSVTFGLVVECFLEIGKGPHGSA